MKLRLLALTPEEKILGLSVVPDLKPDEYAQFNYDEPCSSPYWNKGVKYPIDIGFYNKEKELVFKTSMEPEQRKLVHSPMPYLYVIETHKGQLPNNFKF